MLHVLYESGLKEITYQITSAWVNTRPKLLKMKFFVSRTIKEELNGDVYVNAIAIDCLRSIVTFKVMMYTDQMENYLN